MSRSITGKVILYVLILLGIDICIAPSLGLFRPVLTYLWIVYVAFHWPTQEVLPSAVLAGILRDLSGTLPLGVETVSLAVLSGLLIFFLRKFQRDVFLMQWIVGSVFIFIIMLFDVFFSGFLSPGYPVTFYALLSCFTVALTSALVMPVFFFITGRWFHKESVSLKKQYELFG